MPDKKFYPMMGNHESYPVNVYDYFSDREDSMNKKFGDAW